MHCWQVVPSHKLKKAHHEAAAAPAIALSQAVVAHDPKLVRVLHIQTLKVHLGVQHPMSCCSCINKQMYTIADSPHHPPSWWHLPRLPVCWSRKVHIIGTHLVHDLQALTKAPAGTTAPALRTLLQTGPATDDMVYPNEEPLTTITDMPTLAPGLALPPQVREGTTTDKRHP